MMKIIDGINAVQLGLYFNETLVISDIHIGYEEALNKQGILIPRFQFKEIINGFDKLFDGLMGEKVKRIIINGDLKHEFGKISETEWRQTLRLLDYLLKRCPEIILIKGNHDTILGPIAKKRGIKIKEHEIIGDKLIIHGDKIPSANVLQKIKTIIIGHEHPAVSLKQGPRVERYKCFLKGKWKRYNLIVLPSFTPVVEGTDVMKEGLLSPFLKQNLDDFEAFIVGDKTYDFGKLKNLK